MTPSQWRQAWSTLRFLAFRHGIKGKRMDRIEVHAEIAYERDTALQERRAEVKAAQRRRWPKSRYEPWF